MRSNEIQLGVIGAGGFGLFALQHFTQVPGVKLVGMAGTHRPAAYACAQRFGIPDIVEVDQLVQMPGVDLIYIATPPFLHYEQAMAALQAGKHVIVEKPLALTMEQANEMIEIAQRKNLLLVTDLMQRYNPLYESVRLLISNKVLGEFLHGYFENYATDEGLPPEHWFWDQSKSGGIFIEHGVHFFDMFEGWLGKGEVVTAQQTLRPGSGVQEQVNCTVRYQHGMVVNFYHGFHQPGRMDRQEMRLLFERGDVTLYEWIPTVARIRAIADEKGTRDLMDLFPRARLDVTAIYGPKDRSCQARFKTLNVYQMIEVTAGEGDAKMHLYGDVLRAMFADQINWLYDRASARKITEENGRQSLAMAIAATEIVKGSRG